MAISGSNLPPSGPCLDPATCHGEEPPPEFLKAANAPLPAAIAAFDGADFAVAAALYTEVRQVYHVAPPYMLFYAVLC